MWSVFAASNYAPKQSLGYTSNYASKYYLSTAMIGDLQARPYTLIGVQADTASGLLP